MPIQRINKSQVAKYRKGEEPSDVAYWLRRPAIERIATLEQIREEYNQWKYGIESRFQRVYRVVKRKEC